MLYEAALIVENGMHRSMRALVVVSADAETQRKRLMQRDGFTAEEAEARILSQAPLEKKLEVADYVIDNSCDLVCIRSESVCARCIEAS